ncbi:MAG: Gfo/Idh/MocA family oxidoreductase [bacterium]|nr:Gfo/Idh/MocA family oxidoreductase [bacterium]
MTRARVGIIGFGDGGQSNAKALRQIEDVTIVAVSDIDEKRYGAVEEIVGESTHFYSRYQDMIMKDGIDMVIVATPDNEHLEPAKYVLEEGRYVFVEKPVATSYEDLSQFRKLADRFPGKILFSEKYSFAYPIQKALAMQGRMGNFMVGSTLYTMWKCDRIMGGGKWRTEHAYNPCAGGLSHNFMTALLFAKSPIVRVRATGQVLTYHENLDTHEGFDTMEGTLEFKNGRRLQWTVCLAVKGEDSPFAHRTVTHTFQFENGSLVYGPMPGDDRLTVTGQTVSFEREPLLTDPNATSAPKNLWAEYNIGGLYRGMHEDILSALKGEKKPLHTIEHGLNVAAACTYAFWSAHKDGEWMYINGDFQF